MPWGPGGMEENIDDLSSDMFLVPEIEWRLGGTDLDTFGGDNAAVSLGGEPVGVSLGVAVSDGNWRA